MYAVKNSVEIGGRVWVVWRIGDAAYRAPADALPARLVGFEPVTMGDVTVFQMPLLELDSGEKLRGCDCWWMYDADYQKAKEAAHL